MPAFLRDIAGYLPEFELTNEALDREYPEWNLQLTAQRMGVTSRRIAADNETALDLAERACRELFARNPGLVEKIDAVVSCTQSSDYIMPSNACLLHGRLELSEGVSVWDLSHACSGYIYALGLANSLLSSGQVENVLLVTADTYSKYINARDRSARVLFGDGAAATWLAKTTPDGSARAANSAPTLAARIVDVAYGTCGTKYDKFLIPAGGCRLAKSAETALEVADDSGNYRSPENIHMAGQEILNFVTGKIPDHVRQLLAKHSLTTADGDLFVFHQASAIVLDLLTRLLRLKEVQVVRYLQTVGNTVSSSIPLALRQAQDAGQARPGQRAVLCGFGVGLSWGSALVEF